jgi:hypothetical protein
MCSSGVAEGSDAVVWTENLRMSLNTIYDKVLPLRKGAEKHSFLYRPCL